ncbi:hypothetical protein HMPREF1860_01329 [Prevotella amnii]|uniref:Large polyvalent protein-associated domain-containing protein n=1 Tax=Prevotella amnii TaxID=419005 RepID=A0A134BC86_9BACT|nr:hypothetical protein [Prevotella amnii]KXB77535.1 hypothetical protein HMPREF1860_01329 [Prevotella amnii]
MKQAALRHAQRTDEQIQVIKKAWLKRNRKQATAAAKAALIGKTAKHPMIAGAIKFSTYGIKEAINQPHSKLYEKNKLVKDIISVIKNATYSKTAKDRKGRGWIFHYLKINIAGIDSYIVIRQIGKEYSFYSITEI